MGGACAGGEVEEAQALAALAYHCHCEGGVHCGQRRVCLRRNIWPLAVKLVGRLGKSSIAVEKVVTFYEALLYSCIAVGFRYISYLRSRYARG